MDKILPPECKLQVLLRNTLVIGLSPWTHYLPLQSGLPMVQRYALEIFSKLMTFPWGLCTGIDGSIVLFGDLCELRVDILCWPSGSCVSLLPLGDSVKTDSPSGVGRGAYIAQKMMFTTKLIFSERSPRIQFLDCNSALPLHLFLDSPLLQVDSHLFLFSSFLFHSDLSWPASTSDHCLGCSSQG